MSSLALTPEETRVLGALVEKQVTTPDYYPLTLNALVNACNQLTNREPVVAYAEATVTIALDGLREKRLASLYHGSDSRVPRYKHTLTEQFVLTPAEVAVICVLLLRGPQTLGELRTRGERLFAFDSLEEVEATLAALIAYTPEPLVTKLPRQPGTKESRYAQLLSASAASTPAAGEPAALPASAPVAPSAPSASERLTKLEEETAALRREVSELRQQLAEFKRQFD
ncbi:MAG TPA: YceH family protein [Opitutus sp.]|nr:YceH family protein [Opitutus sp.]